MVQQVKEQGELDAALKKAGDRLVVVDFYATWCGPCRMIAPKIEEMAVEMDDDVVFLKVDVDEAEEIALKYEVTAMPTFLFFKKGARVPDDLTGANVEKLKERIEKNK